MRQWNALLPRNVEEDHLRPTPRKKTRPSKTTRVVLLHQPRMALLHGLVVMLERGNFVRETLTDSF
jgi:hypothetical protein